MAKPDDVILERSLREGFKKKTSAKLWTLSKVFGTPHPPSKVWTSLISFINLKSNSSQNAPVSSLARNVE